VRLLYVRRFKVVQLYDDGDLYGDAFSAKILVVTNGFSRSITCGAALFGSQS